MPCLAHVLQFEVVVHDVDPFGRQVVSQPRSFALALSQDSELTWLSFTNRNHMVTMDSKFCVRLLNPAGLWVPVFAGANSLVHADSDAIWPVAMVESQALQFRYIYLKRRSTPSFKKVEVVATAACSGVNVDDVSGNAAPGVCFCREPPGASWRAKS